MDKKFFLGLGTGLIPIIAGCIYAAVQKHKIKKFVEEGDRLEAETKELERIAAIDFKNLDEINKYFDRYLKRINEGDKKDA